MRTRWSIPGGLTGEARELGKEVEEQLNEPFWRWGKLEVVDEVVQRDLTPGANPGRGGETEPGGEFPGQAGALVAVGGGTLSSLGALEDGAEGSVIWHVDAPVNVLQVAIFVSKSTEGSGPVQGFLHCRAREFVQERWLGPVFSSLEGEFSPVPLIRDLVDDTVLESGRTVGGIAMKVEGGPAYLPKWVQMGVQFVYV